MFLVAVYKDVSMNASCGNQSNLLYLLFSY